ncbi:putative ribonuclease H-like domain-containing protein [Tanacetum coccineum]
MNIKFRGGLLGLKRLQGFLELLLLSQYTDAKTMVAAIETRFGGRVFSTVIRWDTLPGSVEHQETLGIQWIKLAPKNCLKNYETLKKIIDDLIVKLNQTEFTAATYKRGLATVEEQLITYRKNEVLFSEEVAVLKREVACKDYEINVLKIPPPHPLIYNRPKKLDLSYSGLDEFKEPEFKGYGSEEEKGIKREYSVARNPQQNGVAERRNRTLIEAVRTMLADSKLPTTFWAEEVSTACYVQNKCEGVFVDIFGSRAFRVFNTRNQEVEEKLHYGFLENKPMIEGNGPKWLFDINSLTQSMNYVPVVASTIINESTGTQRELNACTLEKISQDCIVMPIWKDASYFDSPTKDVDNGEPKSAADDQKQDGDGPNNENDEQDKFEDDSSTKEINAVEQHVNTASPEVNTVDLSVSTASSNDQESPKDMFKMGASHTLEATHVEFFSDEDEPIVDLGNITNSYTVLTTPNTRIHKYHPIENVIGDVKLSVQTRRMTKPTSEQGFLSAVYEQKTHDTLNTYLYACFLSQIEPTSIAKALSDSSWVEAMQEELLQFKLQQVWILVDFPIGKRAIGTKWVFKNKKDKRGIVIRNKARILKKFNYTDVKSASTLVDLEKPLVKDGDADDVDVHLYRSMIGSLMILTASSRRYYVCSKPTLGLWYSRDSPFELVAYTDSDYARATQDRKSTTGGYLLTKGFDAGRHVKRGRDTKIPQSSGPPVKVGDEAVHKELGDRMEIGSVSGPRCQDTILGDVDAQTRFETTSNQSNDPPLSRGYTLGSGEDKNPAESDGFHKIIDFLNANQIRYALTLNPTIYTSCIEQFWATAKAKMVNGERQIQDLIDKKKVIIMETSIRSYLHLEDARGTDCLPTATIFKELARMGRKQRKDTAVTQEETQQDDSVPTPYNDPPLSSEDSMQLSKLMLLCTNLQKQGRSIEDIDKDADVSLVDDTQGRSDDAEMFDTNDLHGDEVAVDMPVEITLAQAFIQIKAAKPKLVTTAATTTTTKPKARGVVVQEPSEFRTPQASQPSKIKEKGKAIMIEPEVPLKRKDQVSLDEDLARNLQAQLEGKLIEEERLARKKEEEANIALIELWDNTQAMMEADFELAQRLQTEEQGEITIEERSRLFIELMNKRKKHFAMLRAEEKRRKPLTKAQKRNLMSIYLKNMGGYKHNQLKSKSYEEIQKLFDNEMRRVNTFIPMDSESKKAKSSEEKSKGSRKKIHGKKRAGKE